MDIFVKVNDKEVKLSVTYWKGRYVTLHAVYAIRNEYGYEYDPLAGKTIVLTPMKRENKKKLNALWTVVLANKDNIARLYTEDKFNDVKKLFNEETI